MSSQHQVSAFKEALLRAARRHPRICSTGCPGRPVRAWSSQYPEGLVFPSIRAFAEDRFTSPSVISTRMRMPKEIPDAWVSAGLGVYYFREAYFLPEDEYQAFLKTQNSAAQ